MPNSNKQYVAYVRLDPRAKLQLDTVRRYLAGNQSEHIHKAVEEYCERMLKLLGVPTPQA